MFCEWLHVEALHKLCVLSVFIKPAQGHTLKERSCGALNVFFKKGVNKHYCVLGPSNPVSGRGETQSCRSAAGTGEASEGRSAV